MRFAHTQRKIAGAVPIRVFGKFCASRDLNWASVNRMIRAYFSQLRRHAEFPRVEPMIARYVNLIGDLNLA